jgi:hypothetical protein
MLDPFNGTPRCAPEGPHDALVMTIFGCAAVARPVHAGC